MKKGVERVALMFSPAGAAVGAILTAWNTVQTVIDKGQQIMGVIMTALGNVREIAAGRVAGAAQFIEQTIGKALPVVFSFAERMLGIGNIGARLKKLVQGMRQKLGIDKLINAVMARLKKLVGAGRQVAGQAVQAAQGMIRGIFSRKTFKAGKENHSIWFDTKSGKPQLWVASTPREARLQLHYAHREAGVNVRNSGGMVALGGRNYTEAVIDHERDQGEAKISAALNALSGGNFRTLSTKEKLDSYFKQLSGAHFNRPRVSTRHEMCARTLTTTALHRFLSVSTAFCALLFPAPRTTQHPASPAFSFFDRHALVSALFRWRRACRSQKPPPERNDVLTDVSPSLYRHDVVWHTTPAGVKTLD